jgi:hypothetical protein
MATAVSSAPSGSGRPFSSSLVLGASRRAATAEITEVMAETVKIECQENRSSSAPQPAAR